MQIYRRGDVGEAAARELHGAPGDRSADWIDRPLPAAASANHVRGALHAVLAGDTVVLWLRADDLRQLPADPPSGAVFASGVMAGLEQAPLPPAWRSTIQLTYPVDLPQNRKLRLIYPLTWFKGAAHTSRGGTDSG